jgi:hypothetical protein
MTAYYTCDPDKNTNCSKKACHINGGQCASTFHVEFAKEPITKVNLLLPMDEMPGDDNEQGK